MQVVEYNIQNLSKETVKIIGAELKRRRINQSQTLVNMSGICSVSYISKIENGKIIPKYSVLKELCEEQGITSEELDTLLNVDIFIEQTIEALFWNDRNKIGQIYSKVYTFDNYKVSFIKIIYEMMYYHYNIVEGLLNSIYIIKENLNDNDFYIYNCLSMIFENRRLNYPEVFNLYNNMNFCKNEYLLALASKELFIAISKFGLENPTLAYHEYSKRYSSLFNYSNDEMYDLLIETLVRKNHTIPLTLKKTLKDNLKLEYCLINKDFSELDLLLSRYNPTNFEALLIATAKKDYAKAENIYNSLQLNKLNADEILIANYCNLLNSGSDTDLANYIINVAAPTALKNNDGMLYKMLLVKLTEISFTAGKYKAVAIMNGKYFEMLSKCGKCLL